MVNDLQEIKKSGFRVLKISYKNNFEIIKGIIKIIVGEQATKEQKRLKEIINECFYFAICYKQKTFYLIKNNKIKCYHFWN